MALNRVVSRGPGHIAIDDSNIHNGPSSDVIADGRVKVQFHDNPEALALWCDRFRGSFAGELPSLEHLEPPKPRRTRSFEILADVEKPAAGPRLNIAIHIVGSRGDVQPFIPIAQLLVKPPYSHRVRICTHPVFKDFVEAQGVEFFSIGGDPEALMAYMVKNPGLLPSRESLRGGDVGKRRREMSEIIDGAWRSCIEAGDGTGERVTAADVKCADDLFIADAIIANPPSMAHIHCAEKLGIPLHMVFTMPWSPTKAFPHPLAAMSYGDADKNWDTHLNITGFSFLPLANSYTPPPDLIEFLNGGPAPIYIGFGSIVVDDPQALTRMIFQAIKIAGVRAIVSKGWGGVGAGDVPENVYLIGNCPHDWLFQRVSAVVHHGGAGTTAAGIAAGRPTVIVPFFGDQPFWGQMMARAGAGPTSVPFKDLTAEILAESIAFALGPEVQEVALEMALNIEEEDGAGDAAMDIQDRLEVDNMHDIKPLRHKHWYVDEGAEHPVIGAIAAASGFVSATFEGTNPGNVEEATQFCKKRKCHTLWR
ncbi:hypothetical protein ACHAPT_009832 [Fusarium lateritium]